MSEEPFDPDSLLSQLEEDVRMHATERTEAFKRLTKHYEKEGDAEPADRMRCLEWAFGFSVGDGSMPACPSGKLLPVMTGTTTSGESVESPSFTWFGSEDFAHVRESRNASANPAVRARLSHVLWQVERDHNAGRDAIDSYLRCVPLHAPHVEENLRDGPSLMEGVRSALDISLSLADAERTDRVVACALDTARQLIRDGHPRWVLDLMTLLVETKRVRAALPLGDVRELAEQALSTYGEEPGSWLWRRDWLALVAQIGRHAKDTQIERDARMRIAAAHEQEGDFFAEAGGHLVAARHYEDAVAAYKQAGGCKAEWRRVQRKRERAIEGSRSQMGRVEGRVTIPREDMDRCRRKAEQDYQRDGLLVLAAPDSEALPDPNVARREASRFVNASPLLARIRWNVIQENRVVGDATTPEERAHIQTVRILCELLRLQTCTLAAWVVDALRRQGRTVREEVMGFLRQCPLVAPQRHELLDRAVERYDDGDYISCVHIVVFQIEGIVRDLAGRIGIPETVEGRRGTRAGYLAYLLEEPAMQETLDEKLTMALQAALVEQTGLNLRNLVAHGLVEPDVFQPGVADLLLVLLLQLAVRRPRAADADETSPDPGEGPSTDVGG